MFHCREKPKGEERRESLVKENFKRESLDVKSKLKGGKTT